MATSRALRGHPTGPRVRIVMGHSFSTDELSIPTGRYSRSTDQHRQITGASTALFGSVVSVNGHPVGAESDGALPTGSGARQEFRNPTPSK